MLSYLICRISFYLELKYETGSGLYPDWKWFQGSKSSKLSYIKRNHLLSTPMGYVGDTREEYNMLSWVKMIVVEWTVGNLNWAIPYLITFWLRKIYWKKLLGEGFSLNLSFRHNFIFQQSYSSASENKINSTGSSLSFQYSQFYTIISFLFY